MKRQSKRELKKRSKKEPEGYDSYPAWIVLATNLVSFATYGIGFYLLFLVGIFWGLLYVLYLFVLELLLYRDGCAYCYYYNKVCAFGRGKVAAIFFKKGNPKKFYEKELTMKKMIPHFLVLVFPLVGGLFILFQSFSFFILVLMAIPPFLWLFGNPITYGKLACAYCRQREINCPASEFFMNKQSRSKNKK